MWEALSEGLLQLAVTVIIALLGLATVFVTRYIGRLTESLQEKTDNELVANTLWRLDRLATVTVESVEQQIAGDLREMVKDGKADRKQLVALGKNAVEEVKAVLGRETLEALEETFGDVNALVEEHVESAVRKLKAGK